MKLDCTDFYINYPEFLESHISYSLMYSVTIKETINVSTIEIYLSVSFPTIGSKLPSYWNQTRSKHLNGQKLRSALKPFSANLTKCQTHSNNSSAFADELFECLWPFCETGD